MKIKEAVDLINQTETFEAEVRGEFLNVYCADLYQVDQFISLNTSSVNWYGVRVKSPALSCSVKPGDLARVMDVVQKLLETPVKDRLPEKKYRLVVKRETSFHPKYVSNIITGFDELVFDLSKDEKEARIFSEKELNQIKEREPSLAPAIDAMKEEVKEYDRN